MNCVLIGNYGVGNFGDEALKRYILDTYPEVKWSVISANPQHNELPRLPFGIRSLFTPWWKTIAALYMADAVVFGGGTLFTDIESVRACRLWRWHQIVAKLLGCSVHFAFQGVGPFKSAKGECIAKKAFAHVASISVRDSASFSRITGWKLNTKVVQTFDPIYEYFANYALQIEKNKRTKNVYIIIPRANSTSAFFQKASELATVQSWDQIRILSLQPGSTMEQHVCSNLQAAVPGSPIVCPISDESELASHLVDASMVVSQRYHGALAAIAMGVTCEVVGQHDGDKLHEIAVLAALEDIPGLIEAGNALLSKKLSQKEDAGTAS